MKRIFMTAMLLGFGWALTSRMVGAKGETDGDRELASPLGTIIIDGCELTAQLTESGSNINARVHVTNPTDHDATVTFNFAIARTPAMSPFARMMPIPTEVKRDACTFKLHPGQTLEHEILVQQTPPAATPPGTTLALPTTTPASPIWTMTVARGTIKPTLGWGASGVAPSAEPTVLTDGQAVLAATIIKPAATS